MLGIRPASQVAPTAFAGDQWVYCIEVDDVDGAGALSCVTVRVARLEEEAGSLPTADDMGGFQLVRWLRAGRAPTSRDESSGLSGRLRR